MVLFQTWLNILIHSSLIPTLSSQDTYTPVIISCVCNDLTIELLVFFLLSLKYPKWGKSTQQLEVCRSLTPHTGCPLMNHVTEHMGLIVLWMCCLSSVVLFKMIVSYLVSLGRHFFNCKGASWHHMLLVKSLLLTSFCQQCGYWYLYYSFITKAI